MTQTTKSPVGDEADVPDSANSVHAVSDVENQRQLNDLRREYLDGRSDSINQWLVVIGLVLAFFAVAIPIVTGIAAYVAYREFQNIESKDSKIKNSLTLSQNTLPKIEHLNATQYRSVSPAPTR